MKKIFEIGLIALVVVAMGIPVMAGWGDRSVGASENYIWVSEDGNDTKGQGTQENPYLTLSKALAMVTDAKKQVMLMPGTYSSGASISIPVGINEVLITGMSGDYEATIIHATAGDQAILVNPSVAIGAANYLVYFANLTISGADGVNGVQITDANMTASKKLIVTFRDCGFLNDTDTDKSVVSTHTVASLVKIYMHGRGFGGNNIEGLVYIDCFNAGDRFKANGMNFEGGVEFSTDTVACENEFYACVMKLSGGAGGQDTQQLRANGCISRDGMTQAAAVLGDFAANADEAFLGF